MKKIKIDLKNIKRDDISLIVSYLKRGKVIVYPTDTIYGLGCMANNKRAIEKIYKIKKRKEGKPLLVLVSSIRMVEKYCFIDKEQKKVLKNVWPRVNTTGLLRPSPNLIRRAPRNDIYIRPVTFILKAKGKLPKELTGGQDNLAVRLPKNDFLIKIIKKIRVPLVSTSVNISGEKSLVSVDGIGLWPDLVVDAGKLRGRPSIVVDLRNIEDIKIVRK